MPFDSTLNHFSKHFSQDWLREPVVWLDSSGQIKDANLATSLVFGYPKEQLLQYKIWEFDRQSLHDEWNGLWESMMEKRFVRFYAVLCNNHDQAIHVEVYGQHYWLDENDYMCAMFRDVSESFKYEEQLRASHSKFEQLLVTIPIPVAVFNENGALFLVNQCFENIFGKVPHQKNFRELMSMWLRDENEKLRVLSLLRPILQGKVLNSESEMVDCVNSRGEIRHMEMRVARSGLEVMLCLEDLTDRLSSESDLRKLSQAVMQSKASIVITNTKAEIEYVNPAFLKMTGYSWPEVKGANPRVLQSGFTSKEVFAALWKTITQGKTWKGEFHNKRKDGTYYWESVNISPIKDKNGVITHYVGVKDDATTRKHAELMLKEAKRSAEEANVAKSMFLANMSHEIRTPMNGIMGFTSLLLEVVNDAEQRSYLDMIQRSSESLLKIINDILDLSKIESNKVELFNVSFDLHQTISDVVKLTEGKLSNNKVELKCDYLTLPHWAFGDELRFRQVLTNLMGNAVKFTVEGSVALTSEILEYRDKLIHMAFHITDTGPGIPLHKQQSVFEAFQQADNSITRKFGGTGLGLSLSRKLVQLMGGDIRLTSQENKGSCFSFDVVFGHVDMDTLITEEAKYINEPTFDKKLHLLLCEDNPINQKLAVKILESFGCKVDVAGNGAIGVDMQLMHSYDLILMDLQMPVMDGLMATQKLRAVGCKTPIVAMTANAMQGDREMCISSGMNDYIAKPIHKEQLMETLTRVMKGK